MPEFNEPRLAGWVSSFRDSLEDGAEKIFFDGPKKPTRGTTEPRLKPIQVRSTPVRPAGGKENAATATTETARRVSISLFALLSTATFPAGFV